MKIVLIPSSKLITEDLQNKFGKIPAVLTPVENETILDQLVNKYKRHYDKIIIIAKNKIELIEDYIKVKKYSVEVIELDKIRDLGYSIYYGLKDLINKYDINELLINLGDTIIDYDESTVKNILYYDEVFESGRWTVFNKENNNLNIYDKCDIDGDKFNAFVGVYKISDINIFYEILLEKINMRDNIDSFYNTLKAFNKLNEFSLEKVDKWFDLGHKDNYDSLKKDVKSRYFNTIEIDRKRGILRKSSEEKEKFRNEILWYLKIPNSIQYLTPRIFDYSLDYENMNVCMEYYGYSTIHEMFVYGDFNKNQWRQVYDTIFMAINDMKNFTQSIDDCKIRESLKDMYLTKTINRLNELKEDNSFSKYFSTDIVVNGITYRSLQYYIDNLSDILEKHNIYNLKNLSIIHGDLCFSNILYDVDTGIIRLIDPRGKFGDYDIYGDYRYDLAKLSHSVNGRYDYIINDLFYLNNDKNNLELDIKHTKNSMLAKDIFNEYLDNDIRAQVELIEALLFLSMIPLHKDYPERQLAMLCIGIQLISKFEV